METKEKINGKKKFAEWPNIPCCGTQDSYKTIPDCCKSIGKDDDRRSIMNKCMRGCRWFLFVPVMLGIIFLLLGYFLNPEITRILWMIAAGLAILMGVFGLVMMKTMRHMCC